MDGDRARSRPPDWRTASAGVTTLGTHEIEAVDDSHSRLTLGVQQSGPLAAVIGARTRRYVQMEAEGLKRAAEARGTARQSPTADAA